MECSALKILARSWLQLWCNSSRGPCHLCSIQCCVLGYTGTFEMCYFMSYSCYTCVSAAVQGAFDLICIGVGLMLGAGVFVTTGAVAAHDAG